MRRRVRGHREDKARGEGVRERSRKSAQSHLVSEDPLCLEREEEKNKLTSTCQPKHVRGKI